MNENTEKDSNAETAAFVQLLTKIQDPEEREVLSAYIAEGTAVSILRAAQRLAKRLPDAN
jgi:hypothetical protein